jgi:two-component system copper resistance phosphate regulon response regulator CusR
VKVLVVEDDPRTAALLADGLRLFGLDTDVAQTGIEGLARVIRSDVDIVLLDLDLPDIDGWDVLREARRVVPDLPVLVLTGRDGIDDRVTGLELQADDYLTKPFAFDELVARIHARLRTHREPEDTVRRPTDQTRS